MRPFFLHIRLLLLALLLGGATTAQAETITADFNNGLPEGWSLVGSAIYNNDDRGRSGKSVWSNAKSNTDNYLVTEALQGEVTLYWRSFGTSGSYPNGQLTVYKYSDGALGDQLWQSATYKGSQWQQVTFSLGTYSGQIAIALYSACIDDMSYTVADGNTQEPEPEPEPEPTAPKMEIGTTLVNFGRVEADAQQTITVSNTGNDVLQATIASDNADFTVAPAELSVAAGESATFTLTYLYNSSAYGSHVATITVTPNVGDAVQITASAYVRNPNVWSEEFSANALPDGWEADADWTFSDGVAHSQYSYGTQHYLTTPALLVGAGEPMTFQYKSTATFTDIRIQASKDGADFADLAKISLDGKMDDFATYTIEGLEAGSYRFRFQNDNYDLDNFEGFTLNQEAPVLTVAPLEDANFGRNLKQQPEALTYTVSNTGTGTLAGTIASSDPTLFTVSKSDFSLAAGESCTFDIALVFDENYGDKEAVITIHPTNDGLADVTIRALAATSDPNAWGEDFEEGVIPAGWLNDGWTVGTLAAFADASQMALAPQRTTAGSLTTPRLTAKKDEVLTWDAYLKWNDEPLLVEYSADNKATWTTLYDYQSKDDEQGDNYYRQMSFTAPADGNYYLRFTSKYQNGIDNLSGFQLATTEEQVRETWFVTYAFQYPDANGEWQTQIDTEEMDIIFEGDNVSFNFPNPVTGNAWMHGTRAADGSVVFPNGQYIGPFGEESAYYCGSDGSQLTDITFLYNTESDSYLCPSAILINSSQTTISYWASFINILVSRERPDEPVVDGIQTVESAQPAADAAVYDLQGRRVAAPRRGLYIVNGRKVMLK